MRLGRFAGLSVQSGELFIRNSSHEMLGSLGKKLRVAQPPEILAEQEAVHVRECAAKPFPAPMLPTGNSLEKAPRSCSVWRRSGFVSVSRLHAMNI